MIEAVVFDWAGTTVDYGCFAPVQAFMEAFAQDGAYCKAVGGQIWTFCE